MLRLEASTEVRSKGRDLVVRVARLRNGVWLAQSQLERTFSSLSVWPLDVPVRPKGSEDGTEPIEVVATVLDVGGVALAESRAVLRFVPQRQVLLQLLLERCAGMDVCETNSACHGVDCLTCSRGQCIRTGETASAGLPNFQADAAVVPLEAGSEPPDAGETGKIDGVDGGDGGGVEDAGPVPDCPEQNGEQRCSENGVQACMDGFWRGLQTCEHQTCESGQCVGVCAPGERRCAGLYAGTAEQCGAGGQWETDTHEGTGGTCELACSEGRCTNACATPGAYACSPLHPQVPLYCEDGALVAQALCAQFCRVGEGCVVSPSCATASPCPLGESCCSAPLVPGGSFKRSYDGLDYKDANFPATLSQPYHLDQFEVTVGRFKRWLAAYDQPGAKPVVGDGKSLDPNDPGWLEEWNANLPADAKALADYLATPPYDCGPPTFSASSDNDLMPINCVDWYLAQAFCIWDKGRLPSEAEWNFAAAGGDEQRSYPWTERGDRPLLDNAHAGYGDAELKPVGSYPAGKARWGHYDLVGNLFEMTRDAWADPYPSSTCVDCVNLVNDGTFARRGGAAQLEVADASPSYRHVYVRILPNLKGGFRCLKSQ
ncbi:MAG: SUMF1/EgtB/PvdO family nonheme iron enzyme [Myxococcales bacterium]